MQSEQQQQESGFVCTRCYAVGLVHLRSIPPRAIGLLVLLVPMAYIVSSNRSYLGMLSILELPLWLAVVAIPVVWFLSPSRLHCTICSSAMLVPVCSPRGREILDERLESGDPRKL